MEVLPGSNTAAAPSEPQDIPGRSSHEAAAPPAVLSTLNDSRPRTSLISDLRLNTLSVNENGSFEFDRVVKSGMVRKRTRKTRTWKKVYLVLRRNLLSIYRTEDEEQLRDQINLADLTAVAYLKDPKREHVFGVFTPARNYHLEASSEKDALEWVSLIRREARIEEAEAELSLISPGGHSGTAYRGFGRDVHIGGDGHYGSSSGDAGGIPGGSGIRNGSYGGGYSLTTTRDGIRIPPMEPTGLELSTTSPTEHTGPEIGSYSDFSDGIVSAGGFRDSSLSLSLSATGGEVGVGGVVAGERRRSPTTRIGGESSQQQQPAPPTQQATNTETPLRQSNDSERVIWHGYLWLLKSKGGVRQWKRFWAVLRPQKLAFYKSDEEYSTLKLIFVSQMLDALELDPLSKSKQYCLQIITNDEEDTKTKTYRFCTTDEESLEKVLGGLKSLIFREKVERANLERERMEKVEREREKEKEKGNSKSG
ncbi:MAG: hypothetical protein M1823_000945 [Watsoniomyces obsoletus]|nr:MAG: hypothetical protein M1823_000945 [Watsoniomyces obsoletus]